MYFQMLTVVRLEKPIMASSDPLCQGSRSNEQAVGFTLSMTVRADSMLEAINFAYTKALGAYKAETNTLHLMEQLEATLVDVLSLSQEVQSHAARTNQNGVVFTSGLAFFTQD